MSATDYLLNGVLIAIVVLQVRGHKMTLRLLVLPIVVVGVVAAEYLHGLPSGTANLTLVFAGALAGLLLGVGCGLATAVYRNAGGQIIGKAGALAAVLWIAGVGARLAFAIYVTHGGSGAVGRFSAAHGITTGEAWVDCLILMALVEILSRTAVLGTRYWRLSQGSASRSPASVRAS